MFNPLVSAGGFLGAATKPIIDTAGSIATSFIDAVLVPEKHWILDKNRYVLPSPSDIWEAYLQDCLPKSGIPYLLGLHGIQYGRPITNVYNSVSDKAWKGVLSSKMPKLSIEQLIYLLYSGGMKLSDFEQQKKRYPMIQGHTEWLMKLLEPKFDMGIIVNNHFRGLTEKQKTLDAIRKVQGCNDEDAEKILNSTQYIAPPSDLLRFVVKDVFDDDQIQKLGLDAEYDTVAKAIPWASALGIPKETKIKYNGQEISLDMLRAYWISHWQLMSPTQGYNALHRLRPNRLFRYNEKIPGLKPFEFSELNALLKSNDYVPEQRKWLAASSYNLLGRIDLRRVFESGDINAEELNERYQDAGYAKVDADLLTRYSVNEKEKKKELEDEKRAKKVFSKKVAEVYLAYEIGAIGKDAALTSLLILKVDETEAIANLDAIDLRINRKRVQQYIKMVKDEMFLGLYTGQEAYEQLTFGGVEGYRASQYVIQWQRALSRPRRVASVNTVMAWVKDGLMNFADASSRLEKLGFSNADTLLYLQSAKMDIDKKILMEQIAQQRTENQRIKETERLFRQQVSDLKASQAQLRTYSSIPTMKRWYINDLMDWGTIFQRLQFLGVDMTDINRYKEEWDNEKASG